MTRWYLHRMNNCVALTCERLDDQRGFTRMWPARLIYDAKMRRAMRVALGELRRHVGRIDRAPAAGRAYDAVEVGGEHE